MSDALLRHWHLLRALPRAPRKTTTAQIEARLRGAGFPIDRRSIERDLHKLSATFPLECDDRSRPFGWSWARDAEAFDLPGMDPQTALVLQLAGAHLRPLLPPSDLARLEPFFAQAKAQLDAEAGARAAWAGAVRVVHAGPPLLPPQVPADALEATQTALLEGRRLALRYARRGETTANDYDVSPLALVYRGPVPVLIAAVDADDTPRQFLAPRMRAARVLPEPRRALPGFDIDAYIASGALDLRYTPRLIRLELALEEPALIPVTERPVARDQRLRPMRDGRTRLTARVIESGALHAWLRSLGAWAEVLAPKALRAEFAEHARVASGRYGEG